MISLGKLRAKSDNKNKNLINIHLINKSVDNIINRFEDNKVKQTDKINDNINLI